MAAKYKTPGVYIEEVNTFPNSVVPISSAIPAFVGYTPQAVHEGKSFLYIPVKITSWSEFLTIFGYPSEGIRKARQYSPNYYIEEGKNSLQSLGYISFAHRNFSIAPDAGTIYYLYLSVRLFYQNGGGDAIIVSVGSYGKPSGKGHFAGTSLVNPNVLLGELLNGLNVLKKEIEPTMYVFPEATLLSLADHATLMQAILLQCKELGATISLLDVPGGRNPNPQNYQQAIEEFRISTGSNGLSYGAAYFPFVLTTVLQTEELDYTNLFGGDVDKLAELINPKSSDLTLTRIFDIIKNDNDQSISEDQLNKALLSSSPLYSTLFAKTLETANLIPPSGGMAGVVTMIDNTEGVWIAPANVNIAGVTGVPLSLIDTQQGPLNVDTANGKSINVLRSFPGRGVLVWGARTLDGNSIDFRYINVRRMMIWLEQSCKLAAEAYVFQPNVATTWVAVKSMISNFLTTIWQQGGLQGARPEDAFAVQCGLGVTMTAQDILDGFMNITVMVAVTRPAEFMVFTIRQQMDTSG